MTPTLFLAGVILPAKIFFIQHVHTVLIAIRSKNSNSFGNNCINQVFFVMKKLSMVQNICTTVLKFLYSEKATKFCEIFTLLFTGTT